MISLAKALSDARYAVAHRDQLITQRECIDIFSGLLSEIDQLSVIVKIAFPFVDSQAKAEHMLDGFKPRERPLDQFVKTMEGAIERHAIPADPQALPSPAYEQSAQVGA